MTFLRRCPKIQTQHFGIRDSAAGRSAVLFFIVSLAGQPGDALHPIRTCSEEVILCQILNCCIFFCSLH